MFKQMFEHTRPLCIVPSVYTWPGWEWCRKVLHAQMSVLSTNASVNILWHFKVCYLDVEWMYLGHCYIRNSLFPTCTSSNTGECLRRFSCSLNACIALLSSSMATVVVWMAYQVVILFGCCCALHLATISSMWSLFGGLVHYSFEPFDCHHHHKYNTWKDFQYCSHMLSSKFNRKKYTYSGDSQ